MMLRIAACAAVVLAAIMFAIRILIWQWRPHTRPCSWFGHDKKYVAIKCCGAISMSDPNSNGRPFPCDHKHKIGDQGIYIARWVCRRCPMMVEECLGTGKDWTIEHETLVPDVKKWTNWSQNPRPVIEASKEAREKLQEIQKRLDTEKCAAYCEGCGLMHTGGSCPGGLS